MGGLGHMQLRRYCHCHRPAGNWYWPGYRCSKGESANIRKHWEQGRRNKHSCRQGPRRHRCWSRWRRSFPPLEDISGDIERFESCTRPLFLLLARQSLLESRKNHSRLVDNGTELGSMDWLMASWARTAMAAETRMDCILNRICK